MIVLLPLVAFLAGARLMATWSGRSVVVAQLQRHASPDDRRPLNQRLHYDPDAVGRHWGALGREALAAEQRFLQIDFVFPLLYGAALVISLLAGARIVMPSVAPAWLIVLVAVAVLSDWTENLVQVTQLRRYLDGGASSLQASWIGVASIATAVKLLSFGVATLGVTTLAAATIWRAAK